MNKQISGTGGHGLGGADHVDIEGLLAYAHGETRGAEADAVLQHSRACRECGDELAVILALAGTQVVAVAEDEREIAGASRRWIALVAASVVLALLLGVALRSAWLPLGATSDEDVVGLATTEAPERLMLEYLFGASTVSVGAPQVRDGFALVVDRRYEAAAALLSTLYDAQPGDNELAASLGIALYLSGDDGERVASLLMQGQRLRDRRLDSFGNLAAWYLANLYLRRGDVVQARDVLEDLSQWSDAPGAEARAVLEQLRPEIR